MKKIFWSYEVTQNNYLFDKIDLIDSKMQLAEQGIIFQSNAYLIFEVWRFVIF